MSGEENATRSFREVLEWGARTYLPEALKDFAAEFLSDRFVSTRGADSTRSRLRIHAMGARKILSLIEEGRVLIEIKEEGDPNLLSYGHTFIAEEEKVIPSIGIPAKLSHDPFGLRQALLDSDFIPGFISYFRQLKSSGARLSSIGEFQRALKRTS